MIRNRIPLPPSRESVAVERLLCAARTPRRHRARLAMLRLALQGERSLNRLAEVGDMNRTHVAGCLAAWRTGGFAKLLESSVVSRLPSHVKEAFRDGIAQHRWQSVAESRVWLKKEFDISLPLRAVRYWMIVESAGANFVSPYAIETDLSADAPSKRLALPGTQPPLKRGIRMLNTGRLASLGS